MFNTNDKETSINKLEFKKITTKQKEQIENIINVLEWNDLKEIEQIQEFLFNLNRVDATLFIGAYYCLKNFSKAKDEKQGKYYQNLMECIIKMWSK